MPYIISGNTDVQYLQELIRTGDGEMRKLRVEGDEGVETTLTVNPGAQHVEVNPLARPGVILLDHFCDRARIAPCKYLSDGFELSFSRVAPPKRFLKALSQPDRVLQSA